ncbi:MAG: hypothetical protein J7M25_13310 [Deltaproteobacteria bacterium]|nr:hypothetical protein [Deltaproteobacteria bacterium]
MTVIHRTNDGVKGNRASLETYMILAGLGLASTLELSMPKEFDPNEPPPPDNDLEQPVSDRDSSGEYVQEIVLDVIAEDDETIPDTFRGCSVVELKTPHGSSVIYKGRDGFAVSEDQAKILIQAYRLEQESLVGRGELATDRRKKESSWETPIPGDMVLRSLGYGPDVPEKLQGSHLIQRGNKRFYLSLDGEAIPEEVGLALLEAFQEQAQPASTLVPRDEASEDEPTQSTNPAAIAAEQSLSDDAHGLNAPPTPPNTIPPKNTTAPSDVVDELPDREEIPKILRGSRLIRSSEGFFFETRSGERVPKEVGESLMEAWEAELATQTVTDARSPFAQPASTRFAPSSEIPLPDEKNHQEGPTDDQAALDRLAAEHDAQTSEPPTGPTPQQTRDDGSISQDVRPETGPSDDLNTTIDEQRGEERSAGAKLGNDVPSPQPSATQGDVRPLSGAALDEALDRIKYQAELLRRDLATGVIRVKEFAPDSDEFVAAFWMAVDMPCQDARLERLVQRSLDIRESLLTTWKDAADRKAQSWRKDLEQGQLILASVNPIQVKDLDLVALVSLVRLRSSTQRNKLQRLCDRIEQGVMDTFRDRLKQSAIVEEIVATSKDAFVQGNDAKEAVSLLVAEHMDASIEAVLDDVRGDEGLVIPNLAHHLATTLTPAVTSLVERIV